MSLHVDLVCRSTPSETDAIRDHNVLLAEALAARTGTTARALDLRHLGDTRDLDGALAAGPAAPFGTRQVVLLQYNPYSFARRGAAWWLARALWRLRRSRPHLTVVLLAHELWLTMDCLRHMVLSPPQRAVFALLRAVSDLVLVSTESLAARVNRLRRGTIGVLPVGSNLPDARSQRTPTRQRLGIREDQRVVAAFGTAHPSRLFTHLRCAFEAVAASDPDAVMLNLGATAPPLAGPQSGEHVLTPGHLTADDLARHVAIADLLLLPFSDGVATRRTTLMAGLQHGVPILGTDGVNTSEELRSSRAMDLVGARALPDAFARRACELLRDDSERRRLGQAGRALYEARFAWPKIAERLLDMIEQRRVRAVDGEAGLWAGAAGRPRS